MKNILNGVAGVLLYLLSTLLVSVVMLNALIAIMGDTCSPPTNHQAGGTLEAPC